MGSCEGVEGGFIHETVTLCLGFFSEGFDGTIGKLGFVVAGAMFIFGGIVKQCLSIFVVATVTIHCGIESLFRLGVEHYFFNKINKISIR